MSKVTVVLAFIVAAVVAASAFYFIPTSAGAQGTAEQAKAAAERRLAEANLRLDEVKAGGSSEAQRIQDGLRIVNEMLPRNAEGFETELSNLLAAAGVQLDGLTKGDEVADPAIGASYTSYSLTVTGSVDNALALVQMLENWPQAVTLQDVKLAVTDAQSATLSATVKVWWQPAT